MLEDQADDLDRQVADLLAHAIDGRIKMYVTARLLRYRRSHPELFKLGSYHPLKPVGARAEAVCAFERRHEQRVLIVAACIRPASVSGGGEVTPVGAEMLGEDLSAAARRARGYETEGGFHRP